MNPEAPFFRDLAIVGTAVALGIIFSPWLGLGILAGALIMDGALRLRERRRIRRRFEREIRLAESQAAGYAVVLGRTVGDALEDTFREWPHGQPSARRAAQVRGHEIHSEIHDEAAALYAQGGVLDRLDHNLDDLR